MNTETTEATPRPKTVTNKPSEVRPTRPCAPHVDVVETPDAFIVRADVPGVSMDAVEVTVEANRLELSAKRPSVDHKGFRPVFRAHREGDYHRSFRIPREINHEEILAELRDGVLAVTLPKASPDRPKKIAVRAG